MTAEELRRRVSEQYPSQSWRDRVKKMPDRQIFAIRMQYLRSLESKGVKK